MHILLIHQAFAALDEPGGTRHHELAHYLVEHGHRVTVIASPLSYLTGERRDPQPAAASADPGITILRATTYAGLHRSFAHRLISFFSFMLSSFWLGIQVKGVDLVWGTSPPIFQGLTSWVLSRLKRVPFLIEVRDLWPAFAIQVGVLTQPLLIRLSEWLEGFLYRQATCVLVNSPGFIEHVERRGARQVELVPNGADVSMFHPDEHGEQYRQVNGLTGKFIALYAGAHGLSNDLGIVLEAADLLRDDPRLAIVLVGSGKDKPALEAQAAAMDLNNVYFLPPVAKLKMPDVLAAANACIAILKPIPLYGTVYPNKVFDYMAAGRPVILAIDGVIRQVVEEAQAGIFVPPGQSAALAEAIRSLADDVERSQEMGRNGRRCVETRFNRADLAVKLESIFEQVTRTR